MAWRAGYGCLRLGPLLIRIGDAAPGDPKITMTGGTMKKYVVILAVLLIGALPLLAQDQPQWVRFGKVDQQYRVCHGNWRRTRYSAHPTFWTPACPGGLAEDPKLQR